jgi:hypothetical protein
MTVCRRKGGWKLQGESIPTLTLPLKGREVGGNSLPLKEREDGRNYFNELRAHFRVKTQF